MQTPACQNCTQQFTITDEDLAFYDRVSPTIGGTKLQVPPPTLCPSCRLQRRLAFRNERQLFRRKCDLCTKDMISLFESGTPFPVYCPSCWWSDKWDPTSYGKDVDFTRPFFEQLKELINIVPKSGLLQLNNENSDYNALLAFSKNTYMSPGSYFMEDSYYMRKSQYSKDCINGNLVDHSELVADAANTKNSYATHHSINSKNCVSCSYIADSSSCKNCFMCSGISNKEYHIKNQPYSKEEYEKIVAEKQKEPVGELWKEFMEFSKTIPKKYQNQIQCENSSGDYLQECKNTHEAYDCYNVEDSKYLIECVSVKDSMDMTMHDKEIELCYEMSCGGDSNYNTKFSYCTCASPNSSYLYSCFYLNDSFGCDGFHAKQQYCILNKKYSKEEYEKLVPKIVEHMRSTGEWGEFFPMTLSTFPYNHTVAQDYFPLTEAEARAKGFQWKELPDTITGNARVSVPKNIQETPNSITQETIVCETCGKSYRIIAQELELSRKIGVALSPRCANCRALHLMSWKNPRKLWSRACAKCSTQIQTTYAPERPELVYCEKCYLEAVY